jgi:hypothetical protein
MHTWLAPHVTPPHVGVPQVVPPQVPPLLEDEELLLEDEDDEEELLLPAPPVEDDELEEDEEEEEEEDDEEEEDEDEELDEEVLLPLPPTQRPSGVHRLPVLQSRLDTHWSPLTGTEHVPSWLHRCPCGQSASRPHSSVPLRHTPAGLHVWLGRQSREVRQLSWQPVAAHT